MIILKVKSKAIIWFFDQVTEEYQVSEAQINLSLFLGHALSSYGSARKVVAWKVVDEERENLILANFEQQPHWVLVQTISELC